MRFIENSTGCTCHAHTSCACFACRKKTSARVPHTWLLQAVLCCALCHKKTRDKFGGEELSVCWPSPAVADCRLQTGARGSSIPSLRSHHFRRYSNPGQLSLILFIVFDHKNDQKRWQVTGSGRDDNNPATLSHHGCMAPEWMFQILETCLQVSHRGGRRDRSSQRQ